MSPLFQRTSLWFCVFAGGMAAFSAAAAEPSQSLAERRLSIIKRTSTGIVLIDLPGEQRPSAAAPAPVVSGTSTTASASAPSSPSPGATPNAAASVPSSSAPASAAQTKPAEVAAPQPAVLNRFFSSMPAPSGRSLQEARRLDAPDQGIALPFGRPAPLPAAEPEVKR
ncbi:MAG: hypothetical protein H7293_13865 [Candidatus Saccharibacteria bacterium]|nr:hypothetical protein [Rhodoferax sp.]